MFMNYVVVMFALFTYTPIKTCSSWLMHDDLSYTYNVYNVGEIMNFILRSLSLYIIRISNRLSGANNVLIVQQTGTPQKNDTSTGGTTFSNLYQINQCIM